MKIFQKLKFFEMRRGKSENVCGRVFPYAKHVFVFTRIFIVVCLSTAKRDIFPEIPRNLGSFLNLSPCKTRHETISMTSGDKER